MIKNIIKIDYNNLFKIKIVQIKTFKIEIEFYLQYIQKITNMHKHTCNIYIINPKIYSIKIIKQINRERFIRSI